MYVHYDHEYHLSAHAQCILGEASNIIQYVRTSAGRSPGKKELMCRPRVNNIEENNTTYVWTRLISEHVTEVASGNVSILVDKSYVNRKFVCHDPTRTNVYSIYYLTPNKGQSSIIYIDVYIIYYLSYGLLVLHVHIEYTYILLIPVYR